MPRRLNLPDSASVASAEPDGRMFAPSAARNAEAIVALAREKAPTSKGKALELASGTGQHIVELARAVPHLTWQPTEVDADRRRSIAAYVAEAGLSNIAPVVALDATEEGWGKIHGGQDFVQLVNLLHLVSVREARTLVTEAAKALVPGGVLMIYGPFMRGDKLTSEGDVAFDASLRAQDSAIGYKSDSEVLGWGSDAGLEQGEAVEMPANNLALVWRKPE